MATKEQIEMLLLRLEEAHPTDFFRRMDETSAGIGAVLRYLYETGDNVTAGKISKFMNVSTARMAVLLKKMESKGLIIKESGVADARTTVVKLSSYGRETVENIYADMYMQIGTIIDKIGMERMMEFVSISSEIRAVVKELHQNCKESR